MQVDNKVLDDLARVAGGAVGAVAGLKNEVEGHVRQRLERMLSGLDMVRRDEFEAVKEMAARARAQEDEINRLLALQQALLDRVTHLESVVAKAAAKADDAGAANADSPA
ncbi:accessory factor UbiK family protein [Nitrospirillum pindoramense]|uniref:BMFP domain-containing protein YqiC n=1 Tax=Nitrospirillum amazonense TaxID=28077 RepID=A0A560GPC4_9PROT|nr:accessory factor UbiK family protein [Nitrospirillum amazonense]TWB35845.1 BMFP domain-containing protein YqiC [Nitrospirillum amazonense]